MTALLKPKFDLQSELDRKVLDALSVLEARHSRGQITEFQLSESIQSLYRAVYGLVVDPSLEEIMTDYEPAVEAKACYLSTLQKLSEKLFVYWRVNSEAVVIFSDVYGEKKVKIPEAADPHLHYKKIIEHLEQKGWKHYDD
jgi:hypothetical protein